MAFETATLQQRQDVVDTCITFNKLANLGHNTGSLQVYGPEVDAAAIPLNAALAAAGIGGSPVDGAVVEGGAATKVLSLGGVELTAATTLVEENEFMGVEVPETAAVVKNAGNLQVRESNGTDIVSSTCPAVVTTSAVQYVTLPATIGAKAQGQAIPVQISGSTSTATTATAVVEAGKLTAAKLPASVAVVANGGNIAGITNSVATSGLSFTGVASNTAAGNISSVKLPATVALVVSGPSTTIPVTGTYATTVTFTVAGGLITGIALS